MRRRRHMKGGFLDSLSNTLSNWGSSISQGTSSMWEKTKNATSSLTNSTVNTNTSQPTMTTTTYGGRHRRRGKGTITGKRTRRMRGGFKDNTPTTGIATHASPISGVTTAKPHNWVGGKTRRHKRKSRRHH